MTNREERKRGIADVLSEIAEERRARGYFGRPTEEILAEDPAREVEDEERERELDAARRPTS